jgi:hypothetical protein
VDWLQAQTLLDLKPVHLMEHARGREPFSKELGIGRVLRGAQVFNRLLKMNATAKSSAKNKKEG